MQDTDYLKEIDLNPTVNGAAWRVNQPLDERALHWFGFVADVQEIRNLSPFRVFVSFNYAYNPGMGLPFPPMPTVDAILDPVGGTNAYIRDENHERQHALVWLDPAAIPAQGMQVLVRLTANAKQQ